MGKKGSIKDVGSGEGYVTLNETKSNLITKVNNDLLNLFTFDLTYFVYL